jgi:hypothetical protein
MGNKIRKNKIRNEYFRKHLGIASISNKIRDTHLRWFVHVQRRPIMVLVRKSLIMQVDNPLRGRGRPKMMLMEVVKIDLKKCNLSEDLTYDRLEWRNKICYLFLRWKKSAPQPRNDFKLLLLGFWAWE